MHIGVLQPYCIFSNNWLGINITDKNGVILILKVESLSELKFDPGFRVIEEYIESNWLDIESQYNCEKSHYIELPVQFLFL